MSEAFEHAKVRIWGTDVGAVSWDHSADIAVFEYDSDFMKAPVELSPIRMPKQAGPIRFPGLEKASFHGLPGMLADSLPDKFGNALIDRWCREQNRKELNPVEKLLYVGRRAMGALEYEDSFDIGIKEHDRPIDIANLVKLSSKILSERQNFKTELKESDGTDSGTQGLEEILMVGSSAGGARAKALIAWNRKTSEIRSGQLELGAEFEHYLIKFDGVSENRDKGRLADPQGFGRIEYAYHLMAKAAGVSMAPCELYEENGRAHFLTKRFDRVDGQKLHMQSLCAIAHYDFNMAGAYSYEQAFRVMTQLLKEEAQPALEQQYRRMVFNVLARNQDDHTKNIAFLMDRQGNWSLSPAFDVTYSYNPEGEWTSGHQMTIAGKRGKSGSDAITMDDLIGIGKHANIQPGKARKIIQGVSEAVREFKYCAHKAKVNEELTVVASHGIRSELLSIY
ncbi:type II toxin-antitoxin system HipA family toxin [Aestuariicella hydrocarbonica]|uniref:Type II toxin-antitoxin system HipA family toxin n=1 Tax=Pseudomaricurvus hydrocarbonicus TaxID=1470433 RepID=A0A9E5MN77_9GAMM|nr:type II toxin-antitoxin system HipA family toxin [Aestuariicella hydrocarbonica]NHO67341.1 type II toxin-antitoxin system HipA family toxin [Aestuariicella hydrocarbonica]